MDDDGPDPALVNQAPAGLGPSGFDLGQWRDLDTAPMLQSVLIAERDEDGWHIYTAFQNEDGWFSNASVDIDMTPKFWMPLPPPPSTERI